MILKILKLEPEWQVVNSSGQRDYMGEVSRVLVASPGPRLMETFFLNLFSSLIGIDAPYLLYELYYPVLHYYSLDGYHNVVWTLGYLSRLSFLSSSYFRQLIYF